MNRRGLLRLLGLGGVGGAAIVVSQDEPTDRLPVVGVTDTSDDKQNGSVEWERQLQSELREQPGYGDVSFATDSGTVEVNDDALLSTVSVEPLAESGDLFRFRAPDQSGLDNLIPLIKGTLRVTEEVSFTANVDNRAISFSGGESTLGGFAAAIGVDPSALEVFVVRANESELLENTAQSSSG